MLLNEKKINTNNLNNFIELMSRFRSSINHQNPQNYLITKTQSSKGSRKKKNSIIWIGSHK